MAAMSVHYADFQGAAELGCTGCVDVLLLGKV